MSCIFRRVRTKDYKKYYFCKKLNCKVEFDFCKNCECKEYKKYKKPNYKKHKRTKATAIQKYVKEAVWYRDNKRCIFCGKLVPLFYANAHYIPRSAGGLGIEENIFTACDHCHSEQDNGLNTKEHDEKAEAYLKSKYSNWDRSKLIYEKNTREEEI